MIGWGVVAGYVLMAIGTGRWVFGLNFPDIAKSKREAFPGMDKARARREALHDSFLWVLTVFSALWWPVVLAFGLVLNPIARTVFPCFGRWFVGPALRNAEKRGVL
jgi:hypothetical protein